MSFANDVSALVAPYWRSEERWRAGFLLGLVVALTLGLVVILVALNDWNRLFYEALQNRDFNAFGPLLIRFAVLAALYIVGAVYKLYVTQMLEIRWRAWLTRRFLEMWLANHVYYRLELEPRSTDNPDQRIAEDLRLFTSATLDLALGVLSSTVTLASFVAILWSISGPLSLELNGRTLVLPAYMVWAAVLYALVGSGLARLVGRPLIGLNFQQQRFEADFRFALVRVREHAEGIALCRGESCEDTGLRARFESIRANWLDLMSATKRLMFFTVGYNQAAVIFPILVAAPRYFSAEISLGVLMQIVNGFGQVQGALSWFVDNYGALARWKASADRLLSFEDRMRAATAAANQAELGVAGDATRDLFAEHLDLRLPTGALLIANASFCIAVGERVLVTGPNGSGKSTLFRAIAGIWPFGRGLIHVPAEASFQFLPQRAYIPIAPLRDAVTYPAPTGLFADDDIRAALTAVGLAQFAPRLDETQNWEGQLSHGEQQRLVIARAVLHRPSWLFLDEATSALDEAGEHELYTLLQQRLPASTLVSIAHRPGVAAYHNSRLVMRSGGIQDSPNGRRALTALSPED